MTTPNSDGLVRRRTGFWRLLLCVAIGPSCIAPLRASTSELEFSRDGPPPAGVVAGETPLSTPEDWASERPSTRRDARLPPSVRLLEERSLPSGGVCRHEVRLDGADGPPETLTHHRLLVLGTPEAARCLESLSKALAEGNATVRRLPTEDDARPEFIAANDAGEVAVGLLWVEPGGGAFQVLQAHLSKALLLDPKLGAAHAQRWRRLLRSLAAGES